MVENPFLETIRLLRTKEEILLHTGLLETGPLQEKEVIDFLEQEYKIESLNYPQGFPNFDRDAALWASKTLYAAAQLFLYRKQDESELENVITPYAGNITPSGILSSDLCLRFLPSIVGELKSIDNEDHLIVLLNEQLKTWHYSAVGYDLTDVDLNFDSILENAALLQMYSDRVIEFKSRKLAEHPLLKAHVKSSLGNYKNIFWNELYLTA